MSGSQLYMCWNTKKEHDEDEALVPSDAARVIKSYADEGRAEYRSGQLDREFKMPPAPPSPVPLVGALLFHRQQRRLSNKVLMTKKNMMKMKRNLDS